MNNKYTGYFLYNLIFCFTFPFLVAIIAWKLKLGGPFAFFLFIAYVCLYVMSLHRLVKLYNKSDFN